MSELDGLLQQKNDLLDQIRQIEESCEGIENEANAKKILDLNERQMSLSAVKRELQTKLSSIDAELNNISSKINELSGTGIDKILNAIKNQRWYFLNNKPKIIFDRDTALLWANLDYFPYANFNGNVNDPMEDYVGEWYYPSPFELWKMIEDKSFPFQEGSNWRIKNCYGWSVYYQKKFSNKDLDNEGATTAISTGTKNTIPCCRVLVTNNYENNISPSNNFYTEKEKLQFTLNIFVTNNLIPLFNDNSVTQLYRQIYVEKPALLKQLSDIQDEINKLQEVVSITSTFDYKLLLTGYNIAEIDKSIIKYYEAVKSLAVKFIEKLETYENEHQETLQEFIKISLQLESRYVDNPNLTSDENGSMSARQKYLAQHLQLGLDEVKKKILSFKEQAESLENKIEDINGGYNSITELAKLEKQDRASFSFIAENLADIVRKALIKIEFFETHKEFVKNVILNWNSWNESYKAFKTQKYEELKAACNADNIESEIFNKWYADWQKKRFLIEQQFLPLIKFSLKGHLMEGESTALKVLDYLQTYKNDIDNFYLKERKNIYQKFAFQAGGDLQEKFETESELYKLTEEFQKAFQEIIFSLPKSEERIFLMKWSEPLLNLQIDEILNFVKDNDLQKISQEVLNQFMELRRQNFIAYLSDSKAYSEAVQQRDKEYNSLIFRMRKDLMKQ
ncbi:MAG: hypothetical protein IJ728_08880 [Selenomonadaceae bacterium]|nr:hypothetical protein [Selenomonadaceae bacterium]